MLELAVSLDNNELSYFRNWDEPKTDSEGKPRFDDNGKPLTRPINAPITRLKKLQRRILTHALYPLGLPEYYFGGIKGKDAVLNARYHQGNKYFFLTDLKDFYPSIGYRNVEAALRKEGFYPEVSRLITRLCTKEGVIPQGCPTSSFLASLVVHHAANDIFEKYRIKGIKVSLYVDDITFSSSQDFKEDVPQIIQELRERGLLINFDKTHYLSKSPLVTGVQVLNNGIAPPKHTFERARDQSRSKASRDGHSQRISYIKKIAQNKRK